TKAPASVKYQRMVHSDCPVAGPWSPLINHTTSDGGRIDIARAVNQGQQRTSNTSTPLARKTQMISDSVQAVINALPTKTTQSKRWGLSVSRTSLKALRAIIAMTAARIP